MLNKLTFMLALMALAISLTRQPVAPLAAAQLPGTSVSTGSTTPTNCGATNTYAPGSIYIQSTNGHVWTCSGTQWTDDSAAGSGVPSGLVAMVASGSCPSGYTEVSALNGAMPYGTLAANGDVGGTGGANTITPTVATLTAAAQTFNGSSATSSSVSGGTPSGTVTAPTIAWPAGVPTFAGTPFSSVINHTHTITSTLSVQGGTTAATTGTHVMTSTATGGSVRAVTSGDAIVSSSANPSGGVSSITPAGILTWPVGVPTNSTPSFNGSALAGHTHTVTAQGTNSPSTVTGTLNSFDNRPAFVKVIYCSKS